MDCDLVHFILIYFWGGQLVGVDICEELIIGLLSITLFLLIFFLRQTISRPRYMYWISLGDLIYKTNNDVGLCIDVTAELVWQLASDVTIA